MLHVVTAESLFVYLRELRQRNIKLALGRVSANFAESNMSVDVIDAELLVIACGVNHPLARRRKLALADLASECRVMPPAGTAMATVVERLFAAARVPLPQAAVVTMSIHMRLHLMNSGGFVTTLPKSMLRHSPLRGSFKVLPVSLPYSPGHIGVVRLKDRALSPVAERFLEMLAETIGRRLGGFRARSGGLMRLVPCGRNCEYADSSGSCPSLP